MMEISFRWVTTSWPCLLYTSRFGDDGVYWKESAKMLANCFYMMQGTPYIFQGDEIGMTNVHYDSVEKFRDVEVFNTYEERKAAGESDEALLKVFCDRARDNGRTPMQWDCLLYTSCNQ